MPEQSSSRRRRLSVGSTTVALSLGLCLCAGQLISMPSANAAAPVLTSSAAAPAKVHPSISNTLSTRTIDSGGTVKVTAKLINPKTGKVVTTGSVRLQAYRNGKWQTWQTAKVGSNGKAGLYGRPKMTGLFRTQYTGSTSYLMQNSGATKVTVRVNEGARILAEAKRHIGALYKFAADGPTRFDCSGFTKYVYKKAVGEALPHKANSQQKYGTAVSRSHKEIGDLIIFRSGSYGYHAAIYAGDGYMYDSPHTGARVGKHKIYGSNYVVRRFAA